MELDKWLFHHAVTLGHICKGIKNDTGENIAFIDINTGEVFDLLRRCGQ